MDAHLFRRLCDELLPGLPGARLEKIRLLGPDCLCLGLYGAPEGQSRKRHLIFKHGRKDPFLFVSEQPPFAGSTPPAWVMRLRKHLAGRHLMAAWADWAERKIYLEAGREDKVWLELDLREGPRLLFSPPPVALEPLWPEPAQILDSNFNWRAWPVITPALRRTLPYLDGPDLAALLLDLEAGGGDVFLYRAAEQKPLISAWPLPQAQLDKSGTNWSEEIYNSVFPALEIAGQSLILEPLGLEARRSKALPFQREVNRLHKLEKKLDEEDLRLQAMCARQAEAKLLQANLYALPKHDKLASLELDDNGQIRQIKLDPKLTIQENMQRLFHQARRGKRGLEHLETRKQTVRLEKEKALREVLRSQAVHGAAVSQTRPTPPDKRGKASANLPRQVQAFRSSDGFLILRGRDSRGNALALKLASSHDYWLHTAQGASAHVIIRRDHPNQEVPQRTLQEAGSLVALKSWLKDQDQVEIQYALAKHISPLRGGGPGAVRIDQSLGSFNVKVNPDHEMQLSLDQTA